MLALLRISNGGLSVYLNKAGDALTEKQTLLDKRRKETEKLAQDTERMLRLYSLSDQRDHIDEELVRLQSEIDVGYYPGAEKPPADCVLKARRILGISQYGFGRRVEDIAADVRKWEHGVSEPSTAHQERIKDLIMSPLVVSTAL